MIAVTQVYITAIKDENKREKIKIITTYPVLVLNLREILLKFCLMRTGASSTLVLWVMQRSAVELGKA